MDRDGKAQLQELVEDHLARGEQRDIALAALVTGVAALGAAMSEVQSGHANWSNVRALLRSGLRDARAGLEQGRGDGRVEALRAFAEQHLAFAALLDDEIVRLTAGETTLV